MCVTRKQTQFFVQNQLRSSNSSSRLDELQSLKKLELEREEANQAAFVRTPPPPPPPLWRNSRSGVERREESGGLGQAWEENRRPSLLVRVSDSTLLLLP